MHLFVNPSLSFLSTTFVERVACLFRIDENGNKVKEEIMNLKLSGRMILRIKRPFSLSVFR